MLTPKDIPYMKALQRQVTLPFGTPLGRGILVFLYANTLDKSIQDIMVEGTFSNKKKYHWYFLPARYYGKIYNKVFRKRDIKERLEIYTKVNKETGLTGYKTEVIRPNEDRNMYYDLYQHIQIFNEYTTAVPASKYIKLFWDYFIPIWKETYGNYKEKYILLNVNQFPMVKEGTLRERLKNPTYLFYYTMWKHLDYMNTLDIDFLFFCNGKVLRMNPSKLDDKSYRVFLAQLKRLYDVASIPELENDTAEELDDTKPTSDTSTKEKNDQEIPLPWNHALLDKPKFAMNMAKQLVPTEKGATALAKKIEKKLEEKEKVIKQEVSASGADVKENEEEISKKAVKEVENDEEVIREIYAQMMADKPQQKSERSTARDEMLREKQKELNVKGMTVEQLKELNTKDVKIEHTTLGSNLKTTNPNMRDIKFNNFNKTYNEKVMNKDIIGAFTELNNKSIGMYIRDIKVEDSSDELNYKDTWTIYLEDENRQRHTVKVDIPKWLDDKFLWIGGNRKIIKNQNFFLPIVKIEPDTVLIVSNYNKMTITRVDTKSLRGISVLDKLLEKSEKFAGYFTVGNSFFDNHKYLTTLEYDGLSKRFRSFQMKNIKLYFSQKEALDIAKKKGIKLKKSEIFVGFKGTEPIILDMDTQRTKDNMGIIDIIFTNLDDDIEAIRKKISVPKRLMYTQVTTMKQDIPMAILLCLWEGLSTVLKKAKVEYRLADRPKDLKTSEDYIRFANCYLIYDASIPNELLLNGLKVLDTSKYDISAFDTKDAYVPYIQKKFGRVSSMNMLFNEYEFMIGHIEREILLDMNCPTDIVGLCIYANHLLCDNDYTNDLNQNLSRIRCGEVIPSILYDRLGKAYTTFKNSNGKKKLSLPQDAVIKELLKLKTVEDYSSLNPFLELEETHGVSTKGFRGINLEKSYSVPKRCYDQTMIGVIAPTSSPDGNCGVNRSLTMEPNINSVRGYADIKDKKLDEVKDVNLFSPAELLIPLGVTTDDSVRTGHSVKQSRHVVPVMKSAPVLISNGSDELCKYYLSSDFVVNAAMDGKVIEKDPKTKIMVVQYKDGSYRAINLDKEIVKNGGGGFELSNQLITNLEVGDTFKQNDTLAWHKDFFSSSPLQGTRLNIGPLTKIAICGTYNTYEDCTFVTPKLSRECTTEMCFKTPAVIGRNSNVTQMVKEGDIINAGDPLIQFDDSFEEADINKLLATLGDDEGLKDAVISNNRNIIKSKYSGVIESIRMYSTAELDELSPSLQQIFGKYYQKIEAKKKLLSKYDKEGSVVKCGMLLSEPTGKVDAGRYGTIRGQKVNDGVLIEFEIKHQEPLEVGSKIANFTALKNVVGEVLDEGLEPWSEFRPDEEIGTFIPPISILARMTPSIFLNAFGNKCIIELKRSLHDIWIKTGQFPTKRKAMEDLIYTFFSAIDKSGSNTKNYKDIFSPMSDAKFTAFFKQFFADDMQYLVLNIVDYERSVTMDDIERAAKVLKVPLYEYVYIPHITGDRKNPTITKERVPVGYINIKRTQQTVAKKNGLSTNIDKRSAITGQVVRADKNGRESDLENIMLTSLGLTNTLKELNGPRADDLVAKQEMLQSINTKGYVNLDELTDDIGNKTTLNTVDTYFLGMSLKTDLVTKGLKTIGTLRKE